MEQIPVVVVGAGPAGLMLSAELRLAGVDVVVLEKLAEPTGESRGLGFTARTMEVFDQRGILSRFGNIDTSNVGHFGGLALDFGIVDGAHFGGKGIPQGRTEEVLAGWACDLGVDLRRGHEVTEIVDDGDGVTICARGPRGSVTLRSAFLVGCDGGRSMVRKAAGFAFPGTAATMEMFIADVADCEIAPRWAGDIRPNGMVMAGPLGDGVTRIVVCERDRPPQRRSAPPPFLEVAAGWQRLTGEDISHGRGLWASSFGDAARQVDHYRRGNVLLVGDAAHIHLPAGGQGMNTSIQDAVNLGWKLAAHVHGAASEGLLDTYHDERHPIGRRLLMNTKAQGLLFLSGRPVQPLRNVMTSLMRHEEVSQHLVRLVSGLEIRYKFDPGTEHPAVGRRLPPFTLGTPHGLVQSLELLHAGGGVLLDFTGGTELASVAAGWLDRVRVVRASPDVARPAELANVDAVLVRPDGHVAWVRPGPGDLIGSLARWFGPSVNSAVIAA